MIAVVTKDGGKTPEPPLPTAIRATYRSGAYGGRGRSPRPSPHSGKTAFGSTFRLMRGIWPRFAATFAAIRRESSGSGGIPIGSPAIRTFGIAFWIPT